jgi:hypothetical protein
MRQLGAVAFAGFFGLACNGGGYSSPTGPPPPPPPPPVSPNILGNYSAPEFWTVTESRSGSPSETKRCEGSLTVATQNNDNWAGRFWAPKCRVPSGPVSGTVDSTGHVVLRFGDQTPFGALDCDFLLSALSGQALSGSIVDGQLSLRGTDSGICGSPLLVQTSIVIRAEGSLGGS